MNWQRAFPDMFPLSHIYVSTKSAKKKSPLLVFGSVLPDVSWTSKSEIARDQIHYAPNEFYKYISNNNPELIDLAVGVKLHSNVNKGADFYSDDTETGFAKVEGRKIEDEVANLLDQEKNDETLGLSHSFIELATDILLNKSNPELLKLYINSIDEIDLNKISGALSKYLNLEPEVIYKEFKNFLGFVGPDAYKTKDSLVDRVMLLIKVRRGKDVDRKKVEKIKDMAIELMEDKYKNYLDNAVSHLKTDFADIL